ncbi:MAG: glycosyl transferase, partial [Chloroflexaceae bacterium]|nr:glycosyl transferase [Chloroflexaceae bacterium]
MGAVNAHAQIAASLKPRLDELQNRQVFQTSRIFDRNGTLLYEFFDAGRRTKVPLDEISPLVISATVAIEDKSFFRNTGVDYEGIFRAIYQNMRAGGETSGASTITQQVVKNIVLTEEEREYENRYQRKVKEIILAQELNQRFSKEQILELYLNEIYYGNLSYGIEAASDSYFDIRARDLNLAQAALLAGLPQLPSQYEPLNFLQQDEAGGFLPGLGLEDGWLEPDYVLPEDIAPPKWRQIAVLRQMVDEGFVTEQAARLAIAEDIRFTPQEVPLNAPHFVFYVRKLLEEKYGKQLVSSGGLDIYTTLDLNLQRMVQEKAAEHIRTIEERNIHNASVVVMQPNTGQILAMVGSIDFNAVVPTTTPDQTGNVLDGQVNVAIRERQPGSALKPFTYLAAMEKGMTPATILWDVPTEFTVSSTENYAPKNYDERWHGPVRIRAALANSLNMPAVKALKFAGLEATLDILDRVGIKTGLKRGPDHYGLALTLGGGEVTLLELTTAYNTLANQGRYIPATPILKITDGNGRVLESYQPQGEQVVDSSLISIVTNMMSDDKAREPVWGLDSKLKLSQPAAVKTGTSSDWRDAWTVGFTPYVTVGVWSGNNNNEPTDRVESLQGGGIIWHNVMEEIFRWIDTRSEYQQLFTEPFPNGTMPTDFVIPPEVQRVTICPLPGKFGNYEEELFTESMLKLTGADQATPVVDPNKPSEPAKIKIPCDAYRRFDVVLIPGSSYYCLPASGYSYPPSWFTQVHIWDVPPPDPNEKIEYQWEGGSATPYAGYFPVCSSWNYGSSQPAPWQAPPSVWQPDDQDDSESVPDTLQPIGPSTDSEPADPAPAPAAPEPAPPAPAQPAPPAPAQPARQ